jgi:hypothetical protein
MDQELNYVNYFTEIERFFQSKRRSFTLVSCLDWVLIESWLERGISLDTVLKGIDRAFANPKRKRDIGSLAYCVKSVEKVSEEQKEMSVETPKLPDFDPTEVAGYVSKLADIIEPFDNGIAESIRAVDISNLRTAEQALSALEEKLIAKLKVTADDKTMIELKREVDSEIDSFRSTMTTAQLVMLEQQMWRRKLLEKFDVPRLSLFYLI